MSTPKLAGLSKVAGRGAPTALLLAALAAMTVGCSSEPRSSEPAAGPVASASAPADSAPTAPATTAGDPVNAASPPARSTAPAPTPAPNPAPARREPEVLSMAARTAVVVTLELDYPRPLPGIAQALAQIERRSEPDDHVGRTFAILDAYGEPTFDRRKLHISMHVSAEKPGLGALVDRRTGDVLWRTVVTPAATPGPAEKALTILIDDGGGKTAMVDGSSNPRSILDATLRDSQTRVREFWPDGIEREVTFIYSACGCPVKAMVRRTGEVTVRTRELPVMFPDDPAAMLVIARLMGWS